MLLKIYSQAQLQKPDPIIQQHIQLQAKKQKGKKNPDGPINKNPLSYKKINGGYSH